MTARKSSRPPARKALVSTITAALDDMKAVNVRVMDVRGVTDIADCMVIASGNSDRHVRSIADRVVERAKAAGFRPYGREGERDGEWVLVDLNDVIVHVMLPRVREFYGLEGLWEPPARAAVRRSPAPRAAKARKKSAGAAPAARPRAKTARRPGHAGRPGRTTS
jgi:ribosome-associated protein